MFTLRRVVPLIVAFIVTAAGPAASVRAGADYRSAVDITFPTVATARYRNDYANARSGGRVHRATDIFAPAGVRVRAVRAGVVVWLPTTEQSGAGWAIQILGDDGRTYAYYHMGPHGAPRRAAIASNVTLGGRVSRGQYLGPLGDSGNAAGGSPHLHFEIHDPSVVDPFGGIRRNPYASLRRAQGLPVTSPSGPAPAPAPAPSSTSLRLGARGPLVAAWQRQLNRIRVHDLPTDGVFGRSTHNATVYFQRTHGLGPAGLGVVGPRTRDAMERELAARSQARTPRPAPAPSDSTTLRRGDRGAAVAAWQRQLNRVRAHDITADGVFGAGTQAATAYFQRSAKVTTRSPGVVDRATRAAMQRALAALAAPRPRPPAPAPTPTAEAVLRRGSQGPAVVTWQRQLNRTRVHDLDVDGAFGAGTERATIYFQESHGLGPDGLGIVGPRTRAVMRNVLAR